MKITRQVAQQKITKVYMDSDISETRFEIKQRITNNTESKCIT